MTVQQVRLRAPPPALALAYSRSLSHSRLGSATSRSLSAAASGHSPLGIGRQNLFTSSTWGLQPWAACRWLRASPHARYAPPPAAALTPEQEGLGDADREFWQQAMRTVDKPNARQMLEMVDWNNRLGVNKARKKRLGFRATTLPCYHDFVKTKARFPHHIVLMRIGEFYETAGFDAVLLVQHAGLNPMSLGSGIPKAGCPVLNLRRQVPKCWP